MKSFRVALVGQPNVGKSMLLNAISNAKLRVGNFAGVTVEKKEVSLSYKDYNITIIDLPGTYALNEYTIEERVSKQFLEDGAYDVILNVADASNLERNLPLTCELNSLNKKMLLALNMMDEATKEGLLIDTPLLEKALHFPCVQVSAAKKEGLDTLLETLINVFEAQESAHETLFSKELKTLLTPLTSVLEHFDEKEALAISLLEKNERVFQKLAKELEPARLKMLVNSCEKAIKKAFNETELDTFFIQERQSFVNALVQEVVHEKKQEQQSFSKKIDALLMHKYLGIPIFLFFMWALFQLTFELGAIPMDYIDAAFASLGELVGGFVNHDGLRSLLVDGIIAGVGAVMLFVPNIMILFLGIALLETTGYMARVAFLLDGFLNKFGLHGKSFIPLITGFGCSVPAYMAARTLKNDKDRLLTLFVIGFMSCGARLPVYVLFTGVFFAPEVAGNVLFAIYIAGAFLGLFAAKFLKGLFFKGSNEPFVMELPKYRLPSVKLVWQMVYTKAYMYMKKAGTFILAATVLIWFASTYPKSDSLESSFASKIQQAKSAEQAHNLEHELSLQLLENSYLGQVGKATEFLFEPLGFDWKMTVALETGLAAKEVIVATLGVLYSLGDDVDESNEGLMNALRAAISLPVALSYMAFIMVYLPCLAASIVFTKEAGGYKYLAYLFMFTTLGAYLFAFIVYRLSLILL